MLSPAKRIALCAAALCLSLAACSLFEYSPYEVPPRGASPEEQASSRTSANLGRLFALPKMGAAGFSIAVLADSHSEYDVLAAAVERINADSSIKLAVMAGDFTQYGLLKEYEWFKKAFSRLNPPYVTVIGNHDALANGPAIYRRMFGPLDYAFTFQGVRFVCVNSNIWEFSFEVPGWSWLEGELAGTADSLRLFVISHIAPFGDQFDSGARDAWTSLMARHRVEYSIHGHQHNFRHEETFGDGVKYLVADNVGDRNFVKITVLDTGVAVERIWF